MYFGFLPHPRKKVIDSGLDPGLEPGLDPRLGYTLWSHKIVSYILLKFLGLYLHNHNQNKAKSYDVSLVLWLGIALGFYWWVIRGRWKMDCD